MTYPVPDDEPARLEALHSYDLIDTPPEEPYERIVQVVRRVLDVPVAGFCLMDEGRQWIKALRGGEMRQTPRDVAFCSHVVATGEGLVICDARVDPRFRDNPLVVGDPGVRAYAGVPVSAHNGTTIGTLMVIDTVPRSFDERELGFMRDMATRLEEHIELRRLAVQLQRHRDSGALDDARAAELDALWRTSGEMIVQELDDLERRAPAAGCADVDDDGSSFRAAVDCVVGSFDLARQMAVNFRHLGMNRDGSFDLCTEVFAPEALVAEIFGKFGSRLDRQNRSLCVEDSTGGFALSADLGVLRRVLEQLVDNALSYSSAGTDVQIQIQPDGDWLTVWVEDRGPGPDKRLGEAVFDAGVTRKTLVDSGPPGPRRGDGLSYVRAAVEAHGGIVGYEHGEPTGCVFWFCVPSNLDGNQVEH